MSLVRSQQQLFWQPEEGGRKERERAKMGKRGKGKPVFSAPMWEDCMLWERDRSGYVSRQTTAETGENFPLEDT